MTAPQYPDTALAGRDKSEACMRYLSVLLRTGVFTKLAILHTNLTHIFTTEVSLMIAIVIIYNPGETYYTGIAQTTDIVSTQVLPY